MSYVLAFLGFAALIILHEAGHFTAAKAVGMRVERFSLFFGPMLLKFRRGETEYGIGPIPLGGYVKITGMNPHEELAPEVVPRAYYNQPVWKRIVVILAGPAVNLVIAFVIVWVLFLANGQAVGQQADRGGREGHPGRHGPQAGRPARLGRRRHAAALTALRAQLGTHRCAGGSTVNGCVAATPAKIVVNRDGNLVTFDVRPRYSAADKRPLVGFEFGSTQSSVGPAHAASLTASGLWGVTTPTVGVLVRIFEPQERKQLNGVVGGYTVTQESFATQHHPGALGARADLAVAGDHQPVPVPAARRRPRVLGGRREGPRPADPVRGDGARRRGRLRADPAAVRDRAVSNDISTLTGTASTSADFRIARLGAAAVVS